MTEAEVHGRERQTFLLGYLSTADEGPPVCTAAVVLQESALFPLAPPSTLWRAAEINVQRKDGWLLFSRKQKHVGYDDLCDFEVDCNYLLRDLKDEAKRVQFAEFEG